MMNLENWTPMHRKSLSPVLTPKKKGRRLDSLVRRLLSIDRLGGLRDTVLRGDLNGIIVALLMRPVFVFYRGLP